MASEARFSYTHQGTRAIDPMAYIISKSAVHELLTLHHSLVAVLVDLFIDKSPWNTSGNWKEWRLPRSYLSQSRVLLRCTHGIGFASQAS